MKSNADVIPGNVRTRSAEQIPAGIVSVLLPLCYSVPPVVNRLHDLIYGLPQGTRSVTERAKTTQASSFRGLAACNTVIGTAAVQAEQELLTKT